MLVIFKEVFFESQGRSKEGGKKELEKIRHFYNFIRIINSIRDLVVKIFLDSKVKNKP